ncbi:MAG: hypothetical protein Tsb002_10280 [Wenzhouxiangellaceae bacterium]
MAVIDIYDELTARLRVSGEYIWPLLLRLIMAWEFWEAGTNKLNGSNWFDNIPWADWQIGFPFPFNQLSTDLNWFFATWGELVFAVMLALGLFTRFAAFSLIVITVVATIAVHWPADWSSLSELWKSYAITAKDGFGNYKLPLLFLIMLFPLVFHGGGKLSIDNLLKALTARSDDYRRIGDLSAAGLGLLIVGVPLVYLFPLVGAIVLIAAISLIAAHRFL